MPEVGVLNLTIRDNSEEAGKGLNYLADALRAVKQNSAALSLAGMARPLNQFANAVKASAGPLSNIGTFLNAVSAYRKAFKEAENVKNSIK